MALDQSALTELLDALKAGGDLDFMRRAMEVVLQLLIELEATEKICGELDAVVAEFRDRPLGHIDFPYVFLDATYVKAHEGPRVVSKAIVIATGVARSGDREVLGLAVGDSEDGAFWTAFLRSLRAR